MQTRETYVEHVVDVTDAAAVQQAMQKIVNDSGCIDILINNAAVYPKVNFLKETADEWLTAININLGGVANCCKAVLPHMIQAGTGRIFNVGSFADRGPIPESSAYATSKGCLLYTSPSPRDREKSRMPSSA